VELTTIFAFPPQVFLLKILLATPLRNRQANRWWLRFFRRSQGKQPGKAHLDLSQPQQPPTAPVEDKVWRYLLSLHS
jgi:hypothetical protein